MSEVNSAEISMWPNPNNGDQLYIGLPPIGEQITTIQIDMFDLYGKHVMADQVPIDKGMNSIVLSLNDLAAGMYMVNVTIGDSTHSQRLMIQR